MSGWAFLTAHQAGSKSLDFALAIHQGGVKSAEKKTRENSSIKIEQTGKQTDPLPNKGPNPKSRPGGGAPSGHEHANRFAKEES